MYILPNLVGKDESKHKIMDKRIICMTQSYKFCELGLQNTLHEPLILLIILQQFLQG